MSHPRLHQMLEELFQLKDTALLRQCLNHPDFSNFIKSHGLSIPMDEMVLAFVHTSFCHEYNVPHQEQLEFLGDSVLGLILAEELYRLYPQEKEGGLSKLKSAIVNEKTLARVAAYLNLNELILVGRGEYQKRLFEQESVLADTLEALLAQIYRHQGMKAASDFFLRSLIVSTPGALSWDFLKDFDAKSKLQEASLAKFKKLPRYSALPKGEKFEVSLWINEELVAQGVFSSKKSGEKELAQEVLKKGII